MTLIPRTPPRNLLEGGPLVATRSPAQPRQRRPFALTRADLDAFPLAACGQTAAAALIERPLAEVLPAFPPHAHCNLRDMQAALTTLGALWQHSPPDTRAARLPGRARPSTWPRRGLVQIFFHGPWDAPEVPFAVSLKASHWVAVSPVTDRYGEPMRGYERDPFVFDVNMLAAKWNHGWMPRSWWEAKILAPLIAETKRATGGWWVRAGLEVAMVGRCR